MSNGKPSNRKTTIDLMRQEESDRKKLFGLQRQSKLGITTVNTGNIGSGGSSGSSGGGVSAGDNLGNHIANQVLNMTIHQVKNVQAPTECNDAVTKCYVDAAIQLLADINGLQTGGGFSEGIIEIAEIKLISTPFYDVQSDPLFIVENVGILDDSTPFFSIQNDPLEESISETASISVTDI